MVNELKEIVFVYNADSGLANSMLDFGHKILRPDTYACSLCALTHGNLGMNKSWKKFVKGLEAEVSFLHKNELKQVHGDFEEDLPAVFLVNQNTLETILTKNEISNCSELQDLISLVESTIKEKNE